ncbi:hypothetical protein BpHYR1_030592 [Brachionus plicatilis]|uniref:Uncharacterized protein n=1 Tax=Brachionus plicatilis TaxID=10195 RepID=A0A3M7RF86_BRAPC|nr:hypothetical protein BpHYR1_030592 [Brachionus plicatilis]
MLNYKQICLIHLQNTLQFYAFCTPFISTVQTLIDNATLNVAPCRNHKTYFKLKEKNLLLEAAGNFRNFIKNLINKA